MTQIRHTNPLGYVDVPILRREGGDAAGFVCPDGGGLACVEANGPDHEHEPAEPDGFGSAKGVGCLIPGEVVETTAAIAALLLEQVGNFEAVKVAKPKKTAAPRKRAAKKTAPGKPAADGDTDEKG